MKTIFRKSIIHRTTSEVGVSIEEKLRQMMANNEPIDTKLITPIYTEKEDGVDPLHDIRTDRFELAQEMQDQNSRNAAAMRENVPTTPKKEEE